MVRDHWAGPSPETRASREQAAGGREPGQRSLEIARARSSQPEAPRGQRTRRRCKQTLGTSRCRKH
eukprot:6953176-Pyramimonas_sp.AAC.1